MPKLPPGASFIEVAAERAAWRGDMELLCARNLPAWQHEAKVAGDLLTKWAALLDELLAVVDAMAPAEAARCRDRAGLPVKAVS